MSVELKTKLDKLCKTIESYHPEADLTLIKMAFEFSDKAHKGQLRSSGDAYIVHPIEVAQTLADMRLDISSIITAILHDTVEDTTVTLEDVEQNFGKDVRELVDGVTKLSKLSFKTTQEKQAENFRKMVIAMAKDIRVIIVKLADRLNNMQTLHYLPEPKQKQIAQETQDIYAPIANRLGISWIKIELEDLCLRFLHSENYQKLKESVSKTKKEREKYIEEVCQIITVKLKDYDMDAIVTGRAKHFHSIFKKMERRDVDFSQVYDIIAFRIVVDNITECYKALGVIHATYKPVPGRFKDYIAMPKANSYQSLHTTVIGPYGERVEIQIRTQDMHQVAERGISAHWKYKEGRFAPSSRDNVEWVNRLLEWQKDLTDPDEFLETVKIDLFEEDVFIFTPKGEVRQLPFGATPLDFAYAIHTDVGHKCIGAKVNGKIVPLKHALNSGDTVDILTSKTQTPSKDWVKIVKSSRAKAKIRAYIKQQERDRANELGKELLEKELKKYGKNFNKLLKTGKFQKIAENMSLKNVDGLFTAVGYGRTFSEDVVKEIVSKEEFEKKTAETEEPQENFLSKVFKAARKRSEARNAISVANLDDVLIRFAKCCNPLPGDTIMGFITRGRGVTVHTGTCTKALDMDQERKIDVRWNIHNKEKVRRMVRIRVLLSDEPGLLATMSQAISASGVNITSASARTTKDRKAILIFDIEVSDLEMLHRVIQSLEKKKEVIAVERMRS
jgi:GTP diphosphokinase / guanosine-3',5'-bis(diphosphate) 3'-diphosphatase